MSQATPAGATLEITVETEAERAELAPLRLLLLADSYWPVVGGGETHSRLLASTLAEKGVEVVVLTQQRFKESDKFERLDGVPVHRVGASGFKRFGKYLMIPGMVRWLLAHRDDYDGIYVCGLRLLGFPAVLLGRYLKKPVVLRSESCEELSGAYIDEHLQGGKRLLLPVAKAVVGLRNRVLLSAHSFLSISDAITHEFTDNGVDKSKVTKIYNGIDMSVYGVQRDDIIRQALRESLDLPQDATLLTYTGKLNRGKGLEYLLAAIKELVAQYPSLHLVLVGAGQNMYLSMEQELKEYVKINKLGESVTFTGYTTRVVDYLNASDFFVMPSEMEALCISLIEALACGLPAVATDVGGIPDVARHEKEALLVPPANVAALVEALRRLLGNPALSSDLSDRGQSRMMQLFDIESVADQHITLFSDLFGTSRQKSIKTGDRSGN